MTLRARFASLGFAFGLVVCGSALAQPPATQPARPATLTAAPAVDGAGPTYERKGRRDPFEAIETLTTDMTSPTLASARLKGIVRGRVPHALVETSDGLGYILKVGDTLAEGHLIEIGVDRVVFSVPARHGSATDRIVLRLPDE